MLEVCALEIQMCIETGQKSQMRQIFNLTQQLSPLINDPKIVAIIKEVGGKIRLGEKRWDLALNEFR